MAKITLQEKALLLSGKDAREALFSLARQLDDGEMPSIFNLLALFEPQN